MDPHKHVDEIGRRALEEFELQKFPEVGYAQLSWMQEHVVTKLLAAVNADALPQYRTVSGLERMPAASSDVALVWARGTLRLDITYYDALGHSHRRTYRRKIPQA